MVTFDSALDVVMKLSADERALLFDIVRRREIEARRRDISANAREVRALLEAGELQPEALDKVLNRLHASLDEL